MASLLEPLRRLLEWLMTPPPLPEHVKKIRDSFDRAARELGLRHTAAGQAHCDMIDGILDGYQVLIIHTADYDVQRPLIAITVSVIDGQAQLPVLESESLLDLYDQNAGQRGPLNAEERAWLLGQRFGNGVSGNASHLVYGQYWEMESSDIAFVCRAMVKLLPYLNANRTSIQGGM